GAVSDGCEAVRASRSGRYFAGGVPGDRPTAAGLSGSADGSAVCLDAADHVADTDRHASPTYGGEGPQCQSGGFADAGGRTDLGITGRATHRTSDITEPGGHPGRTPAACPPGAGRDG